VKAIRQLVSGFESLDKKSVGLVINSAQGWARLLLLPKMSFGELVAAIGLQVKKDTPLSPEETEFKYHIGKPPAGGKAQKFRVIFSCIPKAVAKEQRDLLSQAEVQPTFEAFAPFSFKKWSSVHPVLPQTTFAILDVGARLTEINVYEGYRLQYSRRILLGSETFNDALRSEGLINYQGPPEELARRKLSVTRPVFERFQGELRRSLHYFTDEFRCQLPEQLYLTGGGSNLEGLKEFLERVLEMKIQKLEVLNFAQLSDEVAKRGDGLLRFTRLFLDSRRDRWQRGRPP
jgi:type IV pilus assembly protein PilM